VHRPWSNAQVPRHEGWRTPCATHLQTDNDMAQASSLKPPSGLTQRGGQPAHDLGHSGPGGFRSGALLIHRHPVDGAPCFSLVARRNGLASL
jgi:hypothetical protein